MDGLTFRSCDVSIQSRSDTNSSSDIAKEIRSIQVLKFLGEYSSFFKPSTWNYLHVNLKKLISKRP